MMDARIYEVYRRTTSCKSIYSEPLRKSVSCCDVWPNSKGNDKLKSLAPCGRAEFLLTISKQVDGYEEEWCAMLEMLIIQLYFNLICFRITSSELEQRRGFTYLHQFVLGSK